MADIFISYSREDRGLIDQLSEEVENLGYTVWCDGDLQGGSAWRQAIATEITKCQVLIVLWSENSKKSVFVPQEVDEAMQLEKPVIALRVKGFESKDVPLGFRHIQVILNTSIPQLSHALRSHIPAKQELAPPSVPEEKQQPATPNFAEEVTAQSIFSRAIPVVTMVDRTQTQEGQKLLAAYGGVGRCVRVCGPTKSGKTVLINQALRHLDPIYIPGGVTHDIQSFFDHIAIALDPNATSTPSEAFIFRKAAEAKRPIVIDDYHRIQTVTRKAILKRIQSFLDQDISVVLVSWTDIDNDLIQQDPGLEGRSEPPISLSFWKNTEIIKIGRAGFKALNVRQSPFTLSAITTQSFNNPFLMQQHCLKVAELCGITRRQDEEKSIAISEEQAKEIFSSLCSQTKAHFLPLIEGKNARKFALITGQSTTINGLIALGIRRMEPVHAMSMTKLASNIRGLVTDPSWISAPEIENRVRDFMATLDKSPHKQTAIEFSSDKLHIHPFFKRYLLWDFAPSKGFYPDLINYHDEKSSAAQASA